VSEAGEALPAPLREALARAGERIGARELDRVWIFPERQLGRRASHLAVLSATAENEERRTVYTLHLEVEEGKGGRPQLREVFLEEGTAPRTSVGSVIAGVLRRLEATPEEPREVEIAGDAAAWEALCGPGTAETVPDGAIPLVPPGGPPVDPTNRE
jgi:hypothetical protein